MGSPAIIIANQLCRLCQKGVPNSIARFFGNPEVGYTCPACLVKQQENQHWLGHKLAEESNVETKTVLMPGSAFACVLCGSVESEYYRQVPIDGKIGYVCA